MNKLVGSSNILIRQSHHQKGPPICTNCKKVTCNLKRCKTCKVALYCDKQCQLENWKIHKQICSLFIEGKRSEKEDDKKGKEKEDDKKGKEEEDDNNNDDDDESPEKKLKGSPPSVPSKPPKNPAYFVMLMRALRGYKGNRFKDILDTEQVDASANDHQALKEIAVRGQVLNFDDDFDIYEHLSREGRKISYMAWVLSIWYAVHPLELYNLATTVDPRFVDRFLLVLEPMQLEKMRLSSPNITEASKYSELFVQYIFNVRTKQ